MTLYELNKANYAQLPTMKTDEIEIARLNIIKPWLKTNLDTHYLLMSPEMHYITILEYDKANEEKMSKEVVSLATEVGAIKSIELENNNQGVEIWNDDGMLMLMPYGRGVVKV